MIAQDIEIAILTHNRCAFLREAMEGVCAQSVKDLKISVYDNASSDDTPKVIEAFKKAHPERELNYVRHPKNLGFDGNFKSAADGASCEYLMVLHDDDVMHPQYIEAVARAIEKLGDVALVSTHYGYIKSENQSRLMAQKPSSEAFVFDSQDDFAAYYFYDGRASFSGAIYRVRDLLKYRKPNLYGKIGDINMLINTSLGGKTVIFCDKNFFFYRDHPGQDSHYRGNGPFKGEIFGRNIYFKNILLSSGKFFNRFIYKFYYAEWLVRLFKFAGEPAGVYRPEIRRLSEREGGGLMAKLYATPGLGELLRFLVRLLANERRIHWKKRDLS